MGNCVGGFKRRTTRIAPWKRNRTIVLCFLGIDGAGKTTVVKALQGEDFGTVHPTVGFSRSEVSVKKYKLTVYDLGGSQRIRDIWSTYFAEVYGVVFVVDSSAVSRQQENQQVVDSLQDVPELAGKPILFLLNKKDLPEAMDEMQFSERFKLHSMAKRNRTDIRVEGVCAVKGTGKDIDQVIIEGLEWLIEKILDNYENISKGVEQALKKLREKQAQERLERQHRLALAAARAAEESPEDRSRPGSGENVTSPVHEEANTVNPGTAASEDVQAEEMPALLNDAGGEAARNDNADEKPLHSTSNGEIRSRPATGASMNQKLPIGGSENIGLEEQQKAGNDYRVFEIAKSNEAANVVDEMEMQERVHKANQGTNN